MQQVATEQAWKNLSEDLKWTESLLEKYSDKVDWKEISSNKHITWTIPMLQKFSKKIDWKVLSECVDEDQFTEVHMETFKDKRQRLEKGMFIETSTVSPCIYAYLAS